MKTYRRILLYGNSVILGSLGASLRCFSQFEVMALATPIENPQDFDTLKYDSLLFDLEAPHAEAPFFLLRTRPALVLIGVSPGTNLVRVWSSQQQQEMSMQDLFELIKSGKTNTVNVNTKITFTLIICCHYQSHVPSPSEISSTFLLIPEEVFPMPQALLLRDQKTLARSLRQ